ncbi:hypothetical protein T484DRAFT_1884224 [Baffinella frigidus]|nr:hypothetical protein T484DRAFT_1884224 [Cryptophyta sp. CCMP2293]|mmetsp:Transcript_26011/g.59334  ORF Transcript_26011/g.59334 Transcript_26011/m.59334 type:complete len:168 (-) Transcript_26011:52-555(-)
MAIKMWKAWRGNWKIKPPTNADTDSASDDKDMTNTTIQARPGNFCKTQSSRNHYLVCDSSIASAALAPFEEEQPAPTIASRRRRPAPPALNISSLQPAQTVAVKQIVGRPSALPRVLSTKRPTIKDLIRPPARLPTPSTKIEVASVMPESVDWLDLMCQRSTTSILL